jgi:hypothetical protein
VADDGDTVHEVLVCKGPECGDNRFAGDIADQFRKLVRARRLEGRVRVDRYCCFGRCQSGPNVVTREVPAGTTSFYLVPGRGNRLHLGVGVGDVGAILDQILAATPPAPVAGPDALARPRRSGDDGGP